MVVLSTMFAKNIPTQSWRDRAISHLWSGINGHRPIDPSNIEIFEVIDIDGNRPVSASKMEVIDTLDIDGHRPVTANAPESTTVTTDYMD